MKGISPYPNFNETCGVIITWRSSKLNGYHKVTIIGKPFRAKSGAVLCRVKCHTCRCDHYIPWTSNREIIKFIRYFYKNN